MNKNREQLKTGLRAILSGGMREEPAEAESAEFVAEPEPAALEPKPSRIVVASPPIAEPKETLAVNGKSSHVDAELPHEVPAVVAVPEEPARQQRKKPAPPPPPPPEPKTSMVLAVRVGTLENPYVRKRDNLATRKVGIVLPVALAERMQIHCVKARTRPNEFVARAIEALLDELQA